MKVEPIDLVAYIRSFRRRTLPKFEGGVLPDVEGLAEEVRRLQEQLKPWRACREDVH